MDEPFYYLSAQDRVPRDAKHVIIGGSITVVAPYTFRGYLNLERVELQEGVVEIGFGAFQNCPNLARVACPSSLRTIGDYAFNGCRRLSEVDLLDGLEEIGAHAFDDCDLEMERITFSSSVREIGCCAFGESRLEAVTLAGGTVRLESNAFFGCYSLERIAISSTAIVVEDGWDGNGRAAEVTGGIKYDGGETEPTLLILAPRCLALMSQEDRSKMTDEINQFIYDRTGGAGPLNLEKWGGGALDLDREHDAHQIRACFANCLAEYKAGVAAVLELALWKANMNQRSWVAGRGETARVDAPTRDDCRRTCGADIVIGPVLSYLWGPHRRADHPPRRRW